MCGIAGFAGSFAPELLDRMAQRIAHRGPDDAGTLWLQQQGIGFAHRRLSIIDLSPSGHQPMWDRTNTVAIIFNGEIYNYRELRRELEVNGYAFGGSSDTEVLLNLYLRDGISMLTRLNGIFAFGIWDTRDHSLWVVRDGPGVKPLYYATCEKGFLFASELKALLVEPSLRREFDPAAIQYHLAYLWCPAPHTLLRDVKKLEPGHAMQVRQGKIMRQWRYYDLPYTSPIEPITEDEAVTALRERLRTAVARQMVADVPVGAFLSGGLDSSAIVAMAREHAAGRLSCFTIGLKDAADGWEGMVDDLPYARQVARHLDVDLEVVHVGPEMADHLEKMIYHLDEPQADPASLNVMFISQLARKQGIKVLLGGVAGDDLFTGYRRHYALQQEKYWRWLPVSARHVLARAASVLPPNPPLLRRIGRALRYADLELDERIASYFYWSSPSLVAALCRPIMHEANPATPLLATLSRLPAGTPEINRMLYLEGKHFLADHNLNYNDKMSMAVGVEVRVPFLDPDMIAFAARLPPALKLRGRTGKWVLKRAMEGVLPRNVIYRPKTGFGVPLRRWLRHELRPLLDDTLSRTSVIARGLFDPEVVRALIEDDRKGVTDATYSIFALLCVELWCRIFIDRQGACV